MRFSLNWLKDFFKNDLSDLDLSTALTCAGLEVDAVEQIEPCFEKIVVVKVKEILQHPNANKLCIATVFDGSESLQIVCGAQNCQVGLMTALAPIGSTLKDAKGKKHTIKKGVLRGVESFGMLVSAEELGLEEQSDGIIELGPTFSEGMPLAPFFQDTVLDVSLTPNLGHVMSHLGVAREISALFELPYSIPLMKSPPKSSFKTKDYVKVDIEDSNACPTYGCLLIKNVSVGPSPLWLQQRLKNCGLKTVNNVVDVTNYLLFELGQPMHAFDFDLIDGGEINIQRAKTTSIETLDLHTRDLSPDFLVVSNHSNPIAVAGVIGGNNSKVEDKTTHVLLEAAHFTPKVVRKMSKLLNLKTDASKHFERGTDPSIIETALHRAADLIQEIASGEASAEALIVGNSDFENRSIQCRPEKINQVLGCHLDHKKMVQFLERLEFKVKEKKNLFEITVPYWRNDIVEEIDFAEEIARLYGIENLSQPKLSLTPSVIEDSLDYPLEKVLHQILLEEGLQEVISCDLVSPEMNALQKDTHEPIHALNYMSKEQSSLRTSFLANHLHILKRNQDHQLPSSKIYEIGQVYSMKEELFHEETQAAISLTGRQKPYHFSQKECELDFFDLKGVIENLFTKAAKLSPTFEKSNLPYFHPGCQAAYKINGQIIGYLGEVHPKILRSTGIKKPVFYAFFATAPLISHNSKQVVVQQVPQLPSSERDWTFTALKDLEIGHLINLLSSTPSRILKEVYLLDIYKSDAIGEDKQNVTLRFVYRNDKKTLSFEAIEIEQARLVSEAMQKMKTLIIQPT